MKIDFKNKTVIITGGTRGIGAALVKSFYDIGASVVATGTDQGAVDLLNSETNSPRLKYMQLNFTSENSLSGFIEKIKTFDSIDVLINNAGVNKIDSIENMRKGDWDWINATNLRGPFIITRTISKKMLNAGTGRIVNIASIFSVVSKAQRSAYSATKWGLIGFTKAIALDLAENNILVNAVSPGFVDTDLTRRVLGDDGIEKIKETIPLKRLAQTSEISDIVIFLASDNNKYITGQNIIVDGGFTSA